MRLEYDLNVGALYIALTDSPVATTREVGDNANIDLDEAGSVVGIEVISAGAKWPLAEILAEYRIGDADAAQLRAYFMPAALAAGPGIPPETLPVMVAKPTAPTAPEKVLVPA